MKLSSNDLLNLNIIDEIIPEPIGGAHRDKDLILDNVRASIKKNLDFFSTMDKNEIINHRKNKFLSIGRGDGFSKHLGEETSLSMKITFIENLKNRVILYKKELSVLFAAIIFFVFLYLIL